MASTGLLRRAIARVRNGRDDCAWCKRPVPNERRPDSWCSIECFHEAQDATTW